MTSDRNEGIFYENPIELDTVQRENVISIKAPHSVLTKYLSIENLNIDGNVNDTTDAAIQVEEENEPMIKIHKDWGEKLTDIVETSEPLALLKLHKASNITKQEITDVTHSIQTLLHNTQISALRHAGNSLLLSLPTLDLYHQLGEAITKNTIQTPNNIRVISLAGATLCARPTATIQVMCQPDELLLDSLIDIVLPFSSVFNYLHITTDQSQPPLPTLGMPSLGICLLFPTQCQKHAERTLERLSNAPWTDIPLPAEIQDFLPPGLTYHLNTRGGPVWGIKTGCPMPGVQLLLLVNDSKNFKRMSEFYSRVLVQPEGSPVKSTTGVIYQIFPLSRRSELMMVFYPGIDCRPSDQLSLCVTLTQTIDGVVVDAERIQEAQRINHQQWQIRDPEGNRVLYQAMVR